jgi:hypothetical protein
VHIDGSTYSNEIRAVFLSRIYSHRRNHGSAGSAGAPQLFARNIFKVTVDIGLPRIPVIRGMERDGN